MIFFNYNGKYFKEDTNVISVNSRGLRFGDGLFETMKCRQGKIVQLDEHLERLWHGMEVLQFEPGKLFTPQKLAQDIYNLIEKNGHHVLARVRVTIFKGEGGLFDTKSHAPHYLLQSWPLPEGTGAWNSNGLVLGIYPDVKKSCDLLSNLKHNNFLPYAMAALHAKKNQWNDALILNTNNDLCDTSIANIFLVKNNKLFTPALADGCVAGITRQHLISKLANTAYDITECTLTVDDLLQADEVFLTNSIYNLRWVQQIGDNQFGNNIVREIYNDVFATNR